MQKPGAGQERGIWAELPLKGARSEETSASEDAGGSGLDAKAAPTVVSESIVTSQEPVPVQAPDQPLKLEPGAGIAARVTLVPSG